MTKDQEKAEKLFDIMKRTSAELKALDAAPESSKEQNTKEDQTFDHYVRVDFEYDKETQRINNTRIRVANMSAVGVLCAALTLLDKAKECMAQTGSDINDVMVWLYNLDVKDK